LFNRRDASTIKNSTDFQENMRAALTSLAGDVASSSFDIASILTKALAPGKTMVQYLTDSITSPDDVGAAVKKLSSSDRDRIDQIVSQFKRNKDQIDTAISSLVESLKRRPQFSVAFQTIQRSGGSNNDYRAVLIYDQAISSRLFAAVNGSWDYSDSSKIGADVRGGRAAVEFRYSLTRVSGVSVRTPLDLALSGEGVRGNGDYQYRAQLQLSIPIAAGVTIPVSFGYGNRSEILRTQEKGVYGKFGLTLDVAKLANALLRSSQ
jgi:hypothetical protein